VRAREIGATLVTFGTDYVFDGRSARPYAVDHPRAPQNAYGRSKALGEQLVEQSGAAHLSVRTSWLYAPWGNNFVLMMARLTRERDVVRVVDDQRGRPTSAQHLARTTLSLVEAGVLGTFHVTDGGECTWHGLATVIRDHLRHDCTIEPVTSAEFPRPAPRPPYSVLDLSATEALLGPMPSHRQSVAAALDEAHS
jgi:dTDP-4-dehydrorhamnose reductase